MFVDAGENASPTVDCWEDSGIFVALRNSARELEPHVTVQPWALESLIAGVPYYMGIPCSAHDDERERAS